MTKTTGTPPGHRRDTAGTPHWTLAGTPGTPKTKPKGKQPGGTPPGHKPGHHGTPKRQRRGPQQQQDKNPAQGPPPRITRAQLRTHVTHDTNTEHDFPVGAGALRCSLPQPQI